MLSDAILQLIAQHALRGPTAARARLATPQSTGPTYPLLNAAGEKFWRDPDWYVARETKAVADLCAAIVSAKS